MQQVDDVMMIAGVQDYVEERSLFRLDKDWLAGGGAEPSCCQPGANAKDSVFVHTKEISTPRKMLIRTGSRSVYHFSLHLTGLNQQKAAETERRRLVSSYRRGFGRPIAVGLPCRYCRPNSLCTLSAGVGEGYKQGAEHVCRCIANPLT